LRIKSTSSENTEQLGRSIGSRLRGGELFVLQSDLGGGKTTFTRGIVAGTGSDEPVASPTFTVSRIYDSPVGKIHHFDFYRLQEPGIIAHELAEILDDRQAILIIEWSDIVADSLPEDRLVQITIQQTGDESRDITMQIPPMYAYLAEGLEV